MVLQVLRCFKIFKMLFTNCRDILIGGFKSFCFQSSLTEMLILNEGHHFWPENRTAPFVHWKQNRIPIETQTIPLNRQYSWEHFSGKPSTAVKILFNPHMNSIFDYPKHQVFTCGSYSAESICHPAESSLWYGRPPSG